MIYLILPTTTILVTTNIVALDPGVRNPAICLLIDGTVIKAQRVKLPVKWAKLPPGERSRQIGNLIVNTVEQISKKPITTVIYEWPQIYRIGKSKGNPNKLLPLVAVGATVAALIGAETQSPTPHEWIGNLPKSEKGDPWQSPRGQFIKRRLSKEELENVQNTHDAIDACGLALFCAGRLKLQHVYPGAV